MRVNDVMTADAKTCPATAMTVDAAQRMREEDIGDIVVVDDAGAIMGILTDRDIAVRVVAAGRDPAATPVGEACSGDVVTLDPEQDVDEAIRIMRQRRVRRLPVVNEGRPVGMLALGDLAVQREPDSALADISAKPGNV